ncbi:GNAT family N-acetyltransferase [Isosphaeraceae bacterium EP7]
MAIIVRPYREPDRATLKRLTIDAFEGVSIDHAIDRVLGPLATSDWRDRKGRHVDEDVDAADGAVDVAEASGEILGYVSMRFDRDASVGRIPNVVVAPVARGQGLGRRLLEHAIGRFRAEGMRVARIETLEGNPIGRHLYPSVGFLEVARQVHYAMPLEPEPGPTT